MSEQSESDDAGLSAARFHEVVQELGRPVLSASDAARILGVSQATASDLLDTLADAGRIERVDVSGDPVVWYPSDLQSFADREHVIAFPDRRELVVEHPEQFTRAQLAQFAHLVDSTRDGAYIYRIREEDIWQAPYDHLDGLLRTMRSVLPERSPHLEEWVERQWTRARRFALVTHPDGYTLLSASSPDLMGNVARQKLEAGEHLRADVSDTESWVNDDAVGEVKRVLYEAGYPVQDQRDLETGDPLDVDLTLDLREYQAHWVERFEESGSGVFVGPPGSGKTVAAMGAMASVGGETLVLVPSRDLAEQWHASLLEHTTLTDEQIGEYHGGTKEIRPVTIATYQTAGMDRHRMLFDERRWGLIVYDEVHHVPAAVYRRSADLQAKHRLGLSATPTREDDREKEIFTLIGPPIGTDWSALFEAGFVAEPEVEIRYVPWGDDLSRNEYASAEGHERRQVAAMNPAKVDAVRALLDAHPDQKTLVFVEYLEQGRILAEALDAPFISGEMRHGERGVHFRAFRDGERETLVISRVGDEGIDLPNAEVAIVASGLGGSRRQGAQRAGRTMRPTGSARMYVLATRGTTEEDYARRQLRHLASKGVRVTEGDAPGFEEGSEGEESGNDDADFDDRDDLDAA
ncbi:DEAD/DEAH box helicase [Halomarina ordinaria]|uniref:Putative DNA 3'-5' helicase Rad25 n=1 Tax=Halomarina ordinaria TaxID=3033939 RepID=A0ABD5U4V2_9EURY|nr:DEAD/DEAH box helicase family protein [Halomarina sp. PSRA2]